MVDPLQKDQKFLADGLKEADSAFQKSFNSPNASQALLKALCREGLNITLYFNRPRHFAPLLTAFFPIFNQGVLVSRM